MAASHCDGLEEAAAGDAHLLSGEWRSLAEERAGVMQDEGGEEDTARTVSQKLQ